MNEYMNIIRVYTCTLLNIGLLNRDVTKRLGCSKSTMFIIGNDIVYISKYIYIPTIYIRIQVACDC